MQEIFKALCDENRLRILNLLHSYELCVCEIEVVLNLSQSNVSRHLVKLKNEGIIRGEKDAQWIKYRIDENFFKENKLLMEYIYGKFLFSNTFKTDMKTLKKYKTSSYNCHNITCEKDKVIKYLNTV